MQEGIHVKHPEERPYRKWHPLHAVSHAERRHQDKTKSARFLGCSRQVDDAVPINARSFPARVVYAHRADDAITAVHGSPAILLNQGVTLDDVDRPGAGRVASVARQDSCWDA
jgi:hypothetical protein